MRELTLEQAKKICGSLDPSDYAHLKSVVAERSCVDSIKIIRDISRLGLKEAMTIRRAIQICSEEGQ